MFPQYRPIKLVSSYLTALQFCSLIDPSPTAAPLSLFIYLSSIVSPIKDLSGELLHFEKLLCSQFRGALETPDRHTIRLLPMAKVEAKAPSAL